MDLALVSTAHLDVLAQRTKALRTLYKNIDISADEYFAAKKALRSVLEGLSGRKIEFVHVKEGEEPNGNR